MLTPMEREASPEFHNELVPTIPEEGHIMKISARNVLRGTVRKVDVGAVNAQVTIELAPGIHVVSIVTVDSVRSLGLAEGKPAYAVIKASSVMVGVD